jgi:hypothetical protein
MTIRLNHSPQLVTRPRRIRKYKMQSRRIPFRRQVCPSPQGVQSQVNVVRPISPVIRRRRPHKVIPWLQSQSSAWAIQKHPIKIEIVRRTNLRPMQLRPANKQMNDRVGRIEAGPLNLSHQRRL